METRLPRHDAGSLTALTRIRSPGSGLPAIDVLPSFAYLPARTGWRAWTGPDSSLTQEIAAQATVEQLLDLETRTARLLAERVSEALVARRTTAVRQCPHCSGTKIVRHGRDGGGRQRFRCLKTDESHGCGRTFNGLSGTAFARMRKPELWSGYARHLASGTSLTKIVECGDMVISRHTAWRWRHRLLAPLAAAKPERLGGVVEADETFFLRSFKGHRGWKRGRRRGKPPAQIPRFQSAFVGIVAPARSGPDRH